jgi:hypothetical protein
MPEADFTLLKVTFSYHNSDLLLLQRTSFSVSNHYHHGDYYDRYKRFHVHSKHERQRRELHEAWEESESGWSAQASHGMPLNVFRTRGNEYDQGNFLKDEANGQLQLLSTPGISFSE